MGVSCVMMADLIAETAKLAYQIKAVVSDRGIVLGPVRMEHKTLRAPGAAYESDEQGAPWRGSCTKGRSRSAGTGPSARTGCWGC